MRNNGRARQRGFTLIELVVVIAILGVLAAVSVPLITGYLGQAKELAYDNDVKQVQAAVDAYYSAPDNTKWIGIRQYPIKGKTEASNTSAELHDNASDGASPPTGVGDPKNPLGGTVGGNPKWVDNGDGIRSPTGGQAEENLNGPAAAVDPNKFGWHMVAVLRQDKTYFVDTRDYIIDIDMLLTAGLLDGAPASAADDNCPTTDCTGSYIYYVDANGKVKTLLATFPEANKTGFQDVHP